MNEQATRPRQINMAGTLTDGFEDSTVVFDDVSHGRPRRSVSRFERRLQQKRRESIKRTRTSGCGNSSTTNAYDRETWLIGGVALLCLVAIEVVRWLGGY